MLEFRNVSVSCQHTPILNDISLTFRDFPRWILTWNAFWRMSTRSIRRRTSA